jgi:hypothetical protein
MLYYIAALKNILAPGPLVNYLVSIGGNMKRKRAIAKSLNNR